MVAGFMRNQAKVDAQMCAAVFIILDGLLGQFNLYGFVYVSIYGRAMHVDPMVIPH